MKKPSSSSRAGKNLGELEAYSKKNIDPTKFKPDISVKDWVEVFKPGRIRPFPAFFFPIETLSPIKTIGLGRTNLTIIMSTIVQTDPAPGVLPHANFDRQATPIRNPAIQMHFKPSAYGITSTSTYFMVFALDVVGQSTFQAGGNFGLLSNPGPKVVSGQTSVSLIFKNVPPAQDLFGFLEQTAGGRWTWFSTRVTFPPLVLTPNP
jgi:hypothetical protein